MAATVAQNAVKKIRLPPLPTIKDLINLYGLKAQRQLSQNFLLEPKLIKKIVNVAGIIENGEVCEVGPGPGGITRAILERNPSRVIVIEKDPRFEPMLDMLADSANGKLSVILGDVMTFNMSELFSPDLKREWLGERPNIHLIGNLPFSISTPLIVRWLRDISTRSNAWTYGRVPMTLTFQKEVAERICAPVKDDQRCRLSVMCQNWCRVNTSFTIAGRAFLPPPDVDVGVVKLTPLREPVINLPFELIEKVVRQTFSFRQKFINKGVRTLFPVSKRYKLTAALFELADVSRTLRSHLVTVEEFGRMCHAYKRLCDTYPKLASYNYRGRKATREIDFEEDDEEGDEEDDEEDDDEDDEEVGEEDATTERVSPCKEQ